jgi:hypothetical protein
MTGFKEGDIIRMKLEEIDGFIVSHQNKVRNRVAIVNEVWYYLGSPKKNYRVTWQKRGNRGKEFHENIIGNSARYYEIAP